MKKTINQYKTYNALSKHEASLLNAIDKFLVFSPSTVKKLTGWKMLTVNNSLISLKKKNLITGIKKNYYVLTSKIPENIFKIAATIVSPAYISFWTASSYYGFTEQQVRMVQLVSTKQYPSCIKVGNFAVEVTTYKSENFYGYHQVNKFPLVEKEKLIIDFLYKPEKNGGMVEVRKCLQNAWPQINEKKLLVYLKKFNNKSLFARLGYLLKELKIKNS